jgi:hypothetical protein
VQTKISIHLKESELKKGENKLTKMEVTVSFYTPDRGDNP